MKSHTNAVAEFHNKVSSHVADMPRLLQCDPDHARKAAEQLRQTLTILAAMDSANSELMSDWNLRWKNCVVELTLLPIWLPLLTLGVIAVTSCWAMPYGMPVDEIFWEVHRSNMTKASATNTVARYQIRRFESPVLANILQTASGHQG